MSELRTLVQTDGIAAIVFGRSRIPRLTSDRHQEALLQRAILNHAEERIDGFHAPLHLPLLVGRALHPERQPNLGVAAASVLVWSGARLYDNLLDGDLGEPWSSLPRADLAFTAFGVATVVPPTLLARLEVPDISRVRLHDILARGILELFATERDALIREGGRADPLAVSTYGAGYAMAAALGAEAAGADGNAVLHWSRYGRCLGAVHQLREPRHAPVDADVLGDRVSDALDALDATGADGPTAAFLRELVEMSPQ